MNRQNKVQEITQLLYDMKQGGSTIGEVAEALYEYMERQKPYSKKVIDAMAEENQIDDPHFDGEGYEKKRDQGRLAAQHLRVFHFMNDGRWHTYEDIHEGTGAPPNSAGACMRDFRKARYGSHTVLRQHVKNGLHVYKLIPNRESLTYQYYMKKTETEKL